MGSSHPTKTPHPRATDAPSRGIKFPISSYGRYTPPANVLADRVTIGHTSDYLLLAEVRAATIPEPGTMGLLALGGLELIRRRKR